MTTTFAFMHRSATTVSLQFLRRSAPLLALALSAVSLPLHAADVTVQPAAGSGFVIKSANGASERLRVQESGAISLPGVPGANSQAQSVCINTTSGLLGPCSGGGGAGGGASLPAGTVNQTIRYDASNTPVANGLLQAFSDGGLWAGGTFGTGTIPTTGTGARMMWYPAKAAFRAGWVNTNVWDDANVGQYSIALGENNKASGDHSVALGAGTFASDHAFAMGYLTSASGSTSVAMGSQASAAGDHAVALGYQAQAGGKYAFAVGRQSLANGQDAVALGSGADAPGFGATAIGAATVADGIGSVVIGQSANSNGHNHVFVYNDGWYPAFKPALDDVFMAAALNGFTFNSGTGVNPMSLAMVPGDGVTFITGIGSGVKVATGSGSWTSLSDRDAKTALRPVDAREVLEKVAALRLNSWQYKAQEAKFRHLGPMAQDFYAAFHLGESDKGIDVVDADGVALAAIQGLAALVAEKDAKANARLDEKDREIAALRVELATQKTEIAAQKMRVAELESLAGDLTEVKAQLAALRAPAAAAVTVALRQP